MGVSGKTSKITAFIAAICITIYILAIASGAVRIIENMGERRTLAEGEFYDLADRASSSAVFLGFMSSSYTETIKDFLSGSKTLMGIIISGSEREYAFERNPGSAVIWAGDSPRFRNRAGIPQQPLYLPLRIEGQRNVNIQAVYSKFDNDVMLRVLRNTLLAVLASLAIALITLMVSLTKKNRAPDYLSIEPESAPEPERFHADEEAFTREDEALSPDTPFGNIDFPAENEYENSYEDEAPEIPEEDSGEDNSRTAPAGLYTQRGNVGWESYIRERLASELHRCAASEQDLVFLAMEFKGIMALSDPLFRQLCDEAVGFFGMRDLIFEKGDRGIAVIYPNVDLDIGMAKSDEFRNRITSLLNSSNYGTSNDGDLCIGLSSRAGRLIDADRLTREAFKALEKAMEDPVSPIVAFKSDLEKYREFIKSHPVSS